MLDETKNGGEQPDGILMLAVNESYWLAEGIEYLTPILDGSGFFPTPIICVRFADTFELNLFIGPDRSLLDFWGVNPDIVERLRRDKHLNEISGDGL